jgi:hypothetical protein
MQTLPEHIQCHTFGYGSDHTPVLLVQLAEQDHGGTFPYKLLLLLYFKNTYIKLDI